jgi:hypothetical protein
MKERSISAGSIGMIVLVSNCGRLALGGITDPFH